MHNLLDLSVVHLGKAKSQHKSVSHTVTENPASNPVLPLSFTQMLKQ